jgi:2'-5' RNA ligase
LTLKFLGNVAPEKITGITYALTEVAAMIPPCQLGLGELGAFPNLRRPRVIWVAIKGDVERLAILNKEVESALIPLGFPKESRPFSPHLTLARLRERTSSIEREELGKFTASTPFQSNLIFEVSTLSLMRSELNPAGAVYHRLASIALGRGENRGN